MDIGQLLQDALDETGAELEVTAGKARQLILEEATRLSLAAGEPGFAGILRASRDNVALQLGIEASLTASATEQRILGIVQALLFAAL